MIPNKITPIVYVAGTGGHFLCALLNCAIINHKEPLNFNEWGHAHDSKFGFNNYINPLNIETFKKSCENNPRIQFISTHSNDVDFLLTHFGKMIVITYDRLDLEEIAAALTMKLYYFKNESKEKIAKHIIHSVNFLSMSIKQVDKIDNDKILYVSWSNLFKDDPEILIGMLAEYNSIPKENFNIDTIYEWRKLTAKGITEARKYLP